MVEVEVAFWDSLLAMILIMAVAALFSLLYQKPSGRKSAAKKRKLDEIFLTCF